MSERIANLELSEMADARTDALIAKRIEAMRAARRATRKAPSISDILSGRVSKDAYYRAITGCK